MCGGKKRKKKRKKEKKRKKIVWCVQQWRIQYHGHKRTFVFHETSAPMCVDVAYMRIIGLVPGHTSYACLCAGFLSSKD